MCKVDKETIIKLPLVPRRINEKKEKCEMNTFMNGVSNSSNFTFTENGALTRKTTKSDLLDMFVMGAAYRTRSDSDVILMFRKAFAENPAYATIAQLVERLFLT